MIEYIEKMGGIKKAVFDSIDIIWDSKMIINCPYKINYADFSPFSMEVKDGQLALYYYGKFLKSITLENTDPDRKRLTKINRVPYSRLSYMGGDRLRIHHTDICIFKKAGKPCKFCNLPIDKFKYSFEDIYEIIDFYLREKTFRHILIGGGSENQEQEYLTILQTVRYIRNKTDIPIYVMCLPIDDENRLKKLYDAGVTEIGFNLEIWTDRTAKKIMPGKGSILRKKYLDALKKARKIWDSKYAVRSLLILGLEGRNILSESIRVLCSEGIMPIFSVFRPLSGTEMSNVLPPSNEYLYDTYLMLDQICRDYDQHPGPDCFSCQNNTFALPW